MDAPQWPVSSWKLPLEEVEPIELGEVMLINTMAPFLLCSAFEPLMRNSRFIDRYIVNVTSAEGQFERRSKPAEHPHTNMAKAALNMLTRTAASRCAADWIYMNSVDPGWITHMAVESMLPAENATEPRDAFVPPLDAVDGAARVYDPILRGIHGEPVSGLLLRDYQPAPW
jgi:NAD(P)-dependent dehydrogenase (short-subunit alcohol dehydrogenase family)